MLKSKMRQLIVVFLLAAIYTSAECGAKPTPRGTRGVSGRRAGVSGLVYGGQEAVPGAWPWQLSLQRLSGVDWVHNCGASLLSATKALTTSRAVDGTVVNSLRVVAGMHNPTDLTNTQISNVAYYVMHERYLADNVATLSNDIAMLNLATPLTTSSTVQFLTLPVDNINTFEGSICTITGWGCDELYVADWFTRSAVGSINSHRVSDAVEYWRRSRLAKSNLWLYDRAQKTGICQHDQGGPLSCPDDSGGYIVVGLGSWYISSPEGECLQSYPSVFTRTSAYIDWINSNL